VAASAIVMVAALVVPGAAWAQTSDYTSPAPTLASTGGSNSTNRALSSEQTPRAQSDNLPFTGSDVAQFTVIGLSALGAGLALRRRSRRIA
jgi:LPXTG-motif cell wall-anchored protein